LEGRGISVAGAGEPPALREALRESVGRDASRSAPQMHPQAGDARADSAFAAREDAGSAMRT
jgi:hypothetical protein